MITITFILTALVVLTSWDATAAEDDRQVIPVESDERLPYSRQ